ncbi:MAG: putative glycoside hydrolase [Patescibacteria group bacterium]|nr:putative glycoside hydrolase [Patescibacteria group bacterium]
MINFDYVSPMIYPSHYANGYLGYTVPDNAPYAIFQDSIKKAKSKIDDFNNNLDISTASGTTLFINSAFSPDKDIKEIKKLELEQIRPWIQ